MTQAEREILEGRSKCAFEVIKQLQKRCFLLRGEVKRLRKQLELEHDQGESFLTQIKELQAENERLQAELDGFIHGGL